ncbi:MAG: diacylglycerol/lipid kinase family protein, partial [Gemmatimonadales bacterium]
MAPPEVSIAVVLNPASGSGSHTDVAGRVTELFAARGMAARITFAGEDVQVPEVVRRAAESGVAAVVAGGGDGTVNAVATALARGQVPLGVLPLGTLNHFAKDMGLPLELEEAVGIIAKGNVRVVDVGEVNGRIFLNNSSIGVYPGIVELRDHYREKGVGKLIAAVWASLVVLRRRRFLGVRIESPEGVLVRRTPLVFVGNNEYHMSGL